MLPGVAQSWSGRSNQTRKESKGIPGSGRQGTAEGRRGVIPAAAQSPQHSLLPRRGSALHQPTKPSSHAGHWTARKPSKENGVLDPGPNSGALSRRVEQSWSPLISTRIALLCLFIWYRLGTVSEPGPGLGAGHEKMKTQPFHSWSKRDLK